MGGGAATESPGAHDLRDAVTSSSALPALQHLLGDLGPNIPWSLCPRFGFCLSKNLLVEAKAPKLLI
jgi:hypothetical protein